jgi:hypothetical protein
MSIVPTNFDEPLPPRRVGWSAVATSAWALRIQVAGASSVVAVVLYDYGLVAANVSCEHIRSRLNVFITEGLALGGLWVAGLLLIARLLGHASRREGRRCVGTLGLGVIEAALIVGAFWVFTLPHILHCVPLDLGPTPLDIPPRY